MASIRPFVRLSVSSAHAQLTPGAAHDAASVHFRPIITKTGILVWCCDVPLGCRVWRQMSLFSSCYVLCSSDEKGWLILRSDSSACDAVCRLPVDLAFLLDSSGSIDDNDPDAWTHSLNFVSNVVRQFDVGDRTAHVGIIRYSNNAEVITYLSFDRLAALLPPVTSPPVGMRSIAISLLVRLYVCLFFGRSARISQNHTSNLL